MILTNQTIALYLAGRNQHALYRNHTMHVPPSKATYGPIPLGHGGLKVPAYICATLPLRTYPDLVNQRILLASLRGEPSPYTFMELEAMIAPLTTKEAIIKAAKLGHFRRERDEHLQTRIEEEPLEFLDQKAFHSVIRKAAEEQVLTLAIEQEVIRRLEHFLLKDNDLYTLVFRFQNSGEAWERIKQAVCYFLQQNPSYAGMLFNRGQQSGKWKLLHCDQMQGVRGHFLARVFLTCEGHIYTSSLCIALRKDQAKLRALAEVLAIVAGVLAPPEISESEQRKEDASEDENVLDDPQAMP